jgi:hypothetical protein
MNKRVVTAGAVLVGLAAAFLFGMATIAPKSNDPVAMMQTVCRAFWQAWALS